MKLLTESGDALITESGAYIILDRINTMFKQIIDAAVTALSGISGIGLVTQDADVWNGRKIKDYPSLYLDGKVTDTSRLAYPDATEDDMQAEMSLSIDGEIIEIYPANVEATLDALLKSVETTIYSDSALNALVADITRSTIEKATDTTEKYGLFRCEYKINYFYNHLSP